MRIVRIIFKIILSGIVFASVLPHLFSGFWLIDIFSHFKLQYVIILLFLLLPTAIYSFKKKILPIVLISVLVIWNSSFIVPLYLNDPVILENPGNSLSILSMNLLASNTNYSHTMDLIYETDPDVIVLLELSPRWEIQMVEIYSKYPFRQMYPQNNNFGIGILSRIPMITRVTDLGGDFPPSILGELQIDGNPISILATHPFPPVSQDKFQFRNEQLEEIAKLSKSQSKNFILAGDLNTSSYSIHFQKLLKTGDLKDSRKGFGIASTWPSDFLIMRTSLDHILYKGDMQVLERTTERNIGSDHLPVYLKIGY